MPTLRCFSRAASCLPRRCLELGEAAVKQLASPKARFMQCDISDAASIAAFADTFSAEVGALDVLVEEGRVRVVRAARDGAG